MTVNKIIGEKIKTLRIAKNLSVDDVVQRSGLTISQFTQIEENLTLPSLAPLIKIARVLGVRLGTLLDDQKELGPVVCRKNDANCKQAIHFNNAHSPEHNMTYFALSQDKSGRHMEPFLIEVLPNVNPDFEPSTHEGEEFIFVLNGVIEINYGKDTFVLQQGDSIYYDSIVPHHVHAGNQQLAQIIGVVYTPY
jgi:transcriptional regulator with XRE-family HTH domain